MAVLTAEERTRVEQHISAVEAASSAEVVVATLPQASDYGDARGTLSFLCGLGVLAVVHLLLPELTYGALLLLQLALYFGLARLFAVPALLRKIVSRAQVDAAVKSASERLFLSHRIFETRAQTGVLILLCELEHRVTVLGDRGAHAVIHDEGWEAHVATITQAMRAKQPADGLCAVIEALGRTLSRGLPRPADDTNELPNHVREHTRF